MKTYLVGELFPEKYRKTLEKFGRVVVLPRSEAIPLPVGSHPDTLVGNVGGELFVPKNETDVSGALTDAGIAHAVSVSESGGEYPRDVAVNFFTVGKFFVGKTDSLAPEALIAATRLGYEIIDVGQGYAHCAAAVVGEGIVTADVGIYRSMKEHGVTSLLIESGGIELPPFEYGFIGGASGMINGETAFFFGSLDSHPSGAAIRTFCATLGVAVIEDEGKLCDYGGFIAIDT